MKHVALNQLLCAALINERFRDLLLRHPARALAAGYSGQTFPLTPEERELVLGIRADRLEEFAAAVHSWISGNGRDSGQGAAGRLHGVGRAPIRFPEPVRDFVRLAVAA